MNKNHDDFLIIKSSSPGSFSSYLNNEEASEYMGCEYVYNEFKYIQRTSKVTPKKVGQFVTLWKRNEVGITTPFSFKDDVDFVVILSKFKNKYGLFLFPKEVLIDKGIISAPSKDGKRGFRVYPEWDRPQSAQAIKTQAWQLRYFSSGLSLK